MSSGGNHRGRRAVDRGRGIREGAVTIRRHRMAAVSPDPEKPGQG